MNHFIVSASLASASSLVVAIYLWVLSPAKPINRIAAAYWFSIALWAFFVGSQFRTIQLLSPFWWGWFLHLGCTFIPVLLFHFVVKFSGSLNPRLWKTLAFSYVVTITFNLLNLWTPVFTTGTVYRDAYAYPKPALIYPLYFVLFVTLVIWGTLVMMKCLPALPSLQRSGLRLLLITHVLAYLGGMDNFLIMIDVRIPPLYPFGLYLIPPYALMMMYVVRRYRIFDQVLNTGKNQAFSKAEC